MKRNLRMPLFFLSVIALQTSYYYPQLPPVMASHFGGAGRPNGWSSKEGFFGMYFAVAALVLAVRVLPAMLSRMPNSRINVPNKEYWLAKERRAETIDFIGRQMAWFGTALLSLCVCVVQLAIQTNLPGGGPLPSGPMWLLLGLYCAFVIAWLVRFYRKFSRTG